MNFASLHIIESAKATGAAFIIMWFCLGACGVKAAVNVLRKGEGE